MLLECGPSGNDAVPSRHWQCGRLHSSPSWSLRQGPLGGHRLGIAMPVLAELWFGVELSQSRERNGDRLRRVLPDLIVWPLTEAATEVYGQIARQLRQMGRPIGQIDMLIASIALSLGDTTVVSSDTDLANVPGLSVENWSLPPP